MHAKEVLLEYYSRLALVVNMLARLQRDVSAAEVELALQDAAQYGAREFGFEPYQTCTPAIKAWVEETAQDRDKCKYLAEAIHARSGIAKGASGHQPLSLEDFERAWRFKLWKEETGNTRGGAAFRELWERGDPPLRETVPWLKAWEGRRQ